MTLIKCKKCGKEEEHHAKGLCDKCYKDQWKPKMMVCKRCGKERPHHSKGYCKSCHTFLFHLDKVKEYNHRKYHNIDIEIYKKVTEKCALCNFDKIVELHHLDKNRKNNDTKNMIGLCPNHHKMIHDYRFKADLEEELKKKQIS